jgi:gamma-glutamylcyclotransferase (GGCT)/AIG2-like uncharacterized protein YtfP
MNNKVHYLFSYGTLQLENVQVTNYGRKLIGFKDVLENYKIKQLKITDKDVLAQSQQQYHPIATPSQDKNDCIEGIIFHITEQELIQTDKYEVSEYTRVLETFKSGKKAWIYISNENVRGF